MNPFFCKLNNTLDSLPQLSSIIFLSFFTCLARNPRWHRCRRWSPPSTSRSTSPSTATIPHSSRLVMCRSSTNNSTCSHTTTTQTPTTTSHIQNFHLLSNSTHAIRIPLPILRLQHGSRTQRSHPQKVLRQNTHHIPCTTTHIIIHLQFIITTPTRSPFFQPRLFFRYNTPIRTFIGHWTIVFRWISTKCLNFRYIFRQGSKRIDNNRQKWIPAWIFSSLP
mmetsp:Transcript_4898/g.6726  ORF Transcript_4898/g.6726 Transcript_4898/m.6726 type:complete len:221 (+) Transcript_4898:117-779(+)